MPLALSAGISYWDFWKTNPHIINVMIKHKTQTLMEQDRAMHQLGYYIQSAVSNAIGGCFNGSKHKNSYPDEPLFAKYYEELTMTEEEINDREIKKMIAIQEQWIMYDKQHGIQETVIGE